jgi:hypothetical protein
LLVAGPFFLIRSSARKRALSPRDHSFSSRFPPPPKLNPRALGIDQKQDTTATPFYTRSPVRKGACTGKNDLEYRRPGALLAPPTSPQKLAFGTRAVLEDRPGFAAWKLDLRSASSEFSRALLTQPDSALQKKRRPLSGASYPLSAPSWGRAPPPRHGRHVGRLCLGGRHTAGLPARASTALQHGVSAA